MKRFNLFLLLFLPLLLWGAKPDFLVDADWVAERVNDPKTVILEVRYYPHRYYTVGHIENARQVQRFKDLGANNENPTMRFPKKADFEKTLRSWGGQQRLNDRFVRRFSQCFGITTLFSPRSLRL